jgi:hypothetical protein
MAAVLGWLLLEQVQGAALHVDLASVLRWAVVALLGATLGHGGWVSWRLWRRT